MVSSPPPLPPSKETASLEIPCFSLEDLFNALQTGGEDILASLLHERISLNKQENWTLHLVKKGQMMKDTLEKIQQALRKNLNPQLRIIMHEEVDTAPLSLGQQKKKEAQAHLNELIEKNVLLKTISKTFPHEEPRYGPRNREKT